MSTTFLKNGHCRLLVPSPNFFNTNHSFSFKKKTGLTYLFSTEKNGVFHLNFTELCTFDYDKFSPVAESGFHQTMDNCIILPPKFSLFGLWEPVYAFLDTSSSSRGWSGRKWWMFQILVTFLVTISFLALLSFHSLCLHFWFISVSPSSIVLELISQPVCPQTL